jgi:hypothetical protein
MPVMMAPVLTAWILSSRRIQAARILLFYSIEIDASWVKTPNMQLTGLIINGLATAKDICGSI